MKKFNRSRYKIKTQNMYNINSFLKDKFTFLQKKKNTPTLPPNLIKPRQLT